MGPLGMFKPDETLRNPFENAPEGRVTSHFFTQKIDYYGNVTHPFAQHIRDLMRSTGYVLDVTTPETLTRFCDNMTSYRKLLAAQDAKSDEFQVLGQGLKYCLHQVGLQINVLEKYKKQEFAALQEAKVIDKYNEAVEAVNQATALLQFK